MLLTWSAPVWINPDDIGYNSLYDPIEDATYNPSDIFNNGTSLIQLAFGTTTVEAGWEFTYPGQFWTPASDHETFLDGGGAVVETQ